MFGSPVAPEDLNLPFSMAPSKQGKGGDAGFAEHPQGLLRYRSAPSSLLGELCGEVVRSSSPGTEAVLARFVSGRIAGNSPAAAPGSSQFAAASEQGASQRFQFPSSSSQIAYHPQPRIPSAPPASSFHVVTGRSVDKESAPARGGVGSSSLIRHTSSPAGLVSHSGMENGFDMIRSMGGFRHGSCPGGEAAVAGNRLTGQISFSSRQSAAAASALMSQIPEVGEGLDHSSPDDGALNGNNGGAYIPGYPVASWDNPSLFSGPFDGLKGPRDPPESQNGDIRSHFSSLSHHLSLPRSSPETAAVLQLQDAVPCKVRAKRGCATHPRSIAERVRRTRISQRMRKLQELVPNMEKQTNTADMLDLAVDYIKDLQKRVESLSESKASCTCSCK